MGQLFSTSREDRFESVEESGALHKTEKQVKETGIDRLHKALEIGWTIEHDSSRPILVPPKHFVCNEWMRREEIVVFNDENVRVPHYIWNNSVLKTGRRGRYPWEREEDLVVTLERIMHPREEDAKYN